MTYLFELGTDAIKEFADAYVWYEERQIGLGTEFRTEFYKKLKLVCIAPLHYKTSRKKFHQAMMDRFPFLIV